ncbi:LysM repeat protein [Fontibacillus solani]|uniref:LysM repeat protein n=1 Tax=Fontibacillus solani TaxID=1572857 RepID=A0A7W3XTD9_9BACL|nr:LysM peptidoglycan-binding domain-containing protein [Fontibacillus solani]MBA9087469.1 LysM repeat protein [Fontibacillus solani]
MAYYFYLDKVLLPIAPSKLQLKVNNQNKTLTLINDGEINILKKPKLTDVDFDAMIPQVQYPFALYKDGFQNASYYLKKLEELKVSQAPFQFIVTRTLPDDTMLFDTNMKVSLEDYKVKEDKKDGFDLVVSISLKQYRDFGTKKANISVENDKAKVTISSARPTEDSPAPKGTSKTYKVVKGDTLWAIAKKFYGNGNDYPKIFNANKDKVKNANAIYPGQVLIIPV